MFDKITVIGCGLIGSSILRAIYKKKLSKQINIFDKSKEVSKYIKKKIYVSIFLIIFNLSSRLRFSNYFCPLSSYKEVLLSIKSHLKKCNLTDTGSAKKEVNKIFENLNLKDISWIASHPIAGTEKADQMQVLLILFKNRWCILSSDNDSKKKEMEKLKSFGKNLGSKVKYMNFEDHDYVFFN